MDRNELHLIIGTGPLGQWTARALLEQGRRVRMLNRSGTAPATPAGAEVVKGDLSTPEHAVALLHEAAVVYQCAQPPYHRWPAEFPALQAAILAGARAAGARLVVAENLYMYGDPRGHTLSEATAYGAHTRKGRVRQAMTEALFAAHLRGELEIASARGSDFFGPFDRVSGEQFFLPALAGKPINALGRLDQPHTFTYVADFGRALATLGTDGRGVGRAWHVPSAPPVTQAELFALIEASVGRKVSVRAAGRVLLGLLGLFNPSVAELPEMLYEFEQPFVMDSSAFTTTFGLQPTPLAEAVAATVDWARTLREHKLPAARQAPVASR
jgi:nucleoside-diphosphate-sugar epimerase